MAASKNIRHPTLHSLVQQVRGEIPVFFFFLGWTVTLNTSQSAEAAAGEVALRFCLKTWRAHRSLEENMTDSCPFSAAKEVL